MLQIKSRRDNEITQYSLLTSILHGELIGLLGIRDDTHYFIYIYIYVGLTVGLELWAFNESTLVLAIVVVRCRVY